MKLSAVLAGAGLIGAMLLADRARDSAQAAYARTRRYEDIYYLPPPDQLISASLGHRAALADLIWMKALVYFGTELSQRGGVVHLFRYTDAMLALDPRFKRVYRWVASAAIYRTGNVTIDDVYKAIRYLERAARLFPDDPELAWDLGATYAYELVPMLPVGAPREEARQKSLAYLEMAATHGAGPAWLGLLTSRQLVSLGRTEQALRHMEDLYATATDPALKAELEQRIAALRTASYVEAMRAAAEQLETARVRDFPYVGSSLYMLLGPRPPFDGDALRRRGFDPRPELGEAPAEAARND